MIINSGVTETAKVIGGVDTSNSMRMNLTAQSYSLILENLYKDPLGAVLRELTTNAVEAHQMAGTTDKKVAIQLPTMLDTDLIIRDFGTGLTDDEIEKYLNCLFSSSKGEDNDAMGGFGLGSKSPLALVDSFNLVSVKDGYQYDYMWIKEKGQIPTPIFQGKSKTSRQNGITITVPLGSSTKVPLQNLQRYVAASANRQLFAFQNQVMIVEDASKDYDDLVDISSKLFTAKLLVDLPNISIYHDSAIAGNGGYSYGYGRNYTAKSYVQIGSVIYDYSFADISFSDLAAYFNNLQNFVVAIKVPIGQLELPMSREEVNITDNNKTLVGQAYKRALDDIKQHITTLAFDANTDAAGYYKQIKSYAKTQDSTVLSYKLYPNAVTLRNKEKAIIDIYKTLAAKTIAAGNTYRIDEDFTSLDKTADPAGVLVDQFTRLNKEFFKCSLLNPNGTREAVSPSTVRDGRQVAYFFTTSRLPGNMRYKDLYTYITEKHPNSKPVLIQTPEIDNKLIAEFTKHLGTLLDFHNETQSVVMGVVADQVLKDYSKSLKVAATGTVMATKDFCSGVRLIDMSKLSQGTLRDFHKNGHYATAGHLLNGANNHRVIKLVDDKGIAIPQGPSYIDDTDKVILLTDNSSVALDLTELPSPYLSEASRDYSLKDVMIYKVPTKVLEKTKKALEDDGYTVYVSDLTVEEKDQKAYVAKLPSFADLTDTTSNVYIQMACGILKLVIQEYFEMSGWRVDTLKSRKRISELLEQLKKTYDGADKKLVLEILNNKAIISKFTNEVGSYNSYNMTLSYNQDIRTDLVTAIKDIILSRLHAEWKEDWIDNISYFLDNRIYSSKVVQLHFSQLGFKL